MKVIIVGAGTIGTNLAKFLSEEDHEVYLIEKDEELARRADEKIDAKVIVGNGTDPDVLRGVLKPEADLVIAVTTSDETNLVVCSLSTAFGAKRRIARVRNIALRGLLEEYKQHYFNVDEIIHPEAVAADDIVKTIQAPGACEVADFADGRILLRAFDIPNNSPLCDLKIGELNIEDFPWPFLIIAIVRDEDVIIPQGDTKVQAEDRIYTLVPSQSLGEFLTFVDPNSKKAKKAIIYGATITSELVANALVDSVRDIILLEEDQEKASEIAGRVKTARVINGTASEADILTEAGVEAADVFIATTESDHSNIVSAVLAKKMGAKETIIISHQPDYLTIVDALDIDAIVNPRFLAVDQILQLVRGKSVSSVTKLLEGNAETIELVPEENSPITKAPLKDINFPKNTIVGAVWSENEVALANGNTEIKPGQKVIVFCQETNVKKLQKLFMQKKIL